jgi:oligoendopeptidase F
MHPDLRLAIIEEGLRSYFTYFFFVPLLCNFELQAHQRARAAQPLSARALSQLFLDLLVPGLQDHVHLDVPRMGIQWARYNSLFYSFSSFFYPFGIAAADTIADACLAARSSALATASYLQLLRTGSARSPLQLLAAPGLDLDPAAPSSLDSAFQHFSALLDHFEHH